MSTKVDLSYLRVIRFAVIQPDYGSGLIHASSHPVVLIQTLDMNRTDYY